jgi:hypothetical protein
MRNFSEPSLNCFYRLISDFLQTTPGFTPEVAVSRRQTAPFAIKHVWSAPPKPSRQKKTFWLSSYTTTKSIIRQTSWRFVLRVARSGAR